MKFKVVLQEKGKPVRKSEYLVNEMYVEREKAYWAETGRQLEAENKLEKLMISIKDSNLTVL